MPGWIHRRCWGSAERGMRPQSGVVTPRLPLLCVLSQPANQANSGKVTVLMSVVPATSFEASTALQP